MDMRLIIGEQIRKARELKGLTQDDVAKLLGKTSNAISTYETGKRTIPAIELPDLARVLGVSIEYFFLPNMETEAVQERSHILGQLNELPEPYRRLAVNQIQMVIEVYHVLQASSNLHDINLGNIESLSVTDTFAVGLGLEDGARRKTKTPKKLKREPNLDEVLRWAFENGEVPEDVDEEDLKNSLGKIMSPYNETDDTHTVPVNESPKEEDV